MSEKAKQEPKAFVAVVCYTFDGSTTLADERKVWGDVLKEWSKFGAKIVSVTVVEDKGKPSRKSERKPAIKKVA